MTALRCCRCDGVGTVIYDDDRYSASRGHYTTADEIDCPECRGTGYRRCYACGADQANGEIRDVPLCLTCMEEHGNAA